MRSIDLTSIPKKGRFYDWMNSIGCICHTIWDDIECDFMIIGITKHSNKTYLRYVSNYKHDRVIHETRTEKFTQASFNDIFINTKYKIGDIVNNNMIVEDIFIKADKKDKSRKRLTYKLRCLKCGRISQPMVDNLDRRTGLCPYCESPNGEIDITKEEIIRNRKQYEKYFYNKEDLYKYSMKSDKIIKFICPNCGKIKEMKVSSFYAYGFVCSYCSDNISYPNKIMSNLLNYLHIDFIPEFSPEWIDQRRYDFLLSAYSLIIEMDGAYHYNDVKGNLENAKKIDKLKTLEAIKHGFKIIRINCDYKNSLKRFQYIRTNIINSDLFNILNVDANKINWRTIEIESQHSLFLKACELKANDKEITTKRISDILKINRTTAIDWLKRGNELGLCDYNPITESKNGMLNGVKLHAKVSSKQVVCLDNGIKYKSAQECAKSVGTDSSSISGVCNGKHKHCKRLHFKYLKDLTLEEFTYYNCEQWLKDNDLWDIFVSKNKVV